MSDACCFLIFELTEWRILPLPIAAESRLASLEPPAPSRTRDAEIPDENIRLSQYPLAKGTSNAHFPSVNTILPQCKATRRDQSRPVAE
jgi:hypothetical protein